jgi:hypothetical protein
MPTLQLATVTPEVLRSLREPTDIVDSGGQVVGRYSPRQPAEPLCPWDPDFTVEDAERIYQEGDGTTIEEFWREMGVR